MLRGARRTLGVTRSDRWSGDTVRIRDGADGHFWADVTINGVERRMLIDSGATITALSADTAQAAGRRRSTTVVSGDPIETANGTVIARARDGRAR